MTNQPDPEDARTPDLEPIGDLSDFREHPYAELLRDVEKPARYVGGEFNAVVKDWDAMACRFVLAFPDIYDIGMSHMGTKILYSLVNKTDDLLMERCFCPWVDMHDKLVEHGLPLLSLENHKPLSEFDVVGFSLQYEMTFTNILSMLKLGGIPLRNADRAESDPIVIAGGPVATHPEQMSPFIDAFLIGDAEERLPALLRQVGHMRSVGASRRAILMELATEGGVYCPDLYTREICERSDMMVVTGTVHPDVPRIVERAFLDDISRYRYPDDSPVAVAEAIFDRMSVEIARGCTEGCRFCQAGMIYRPVRERDPDEIVDTVLSAIEKGGYDEANITSLSTADYSCVSPLIKKLMAKLRPKKVSLGISSLRAYGLSDDLLDEIASVKATGLTFAPEAGTQRMRDVINKNITEEDIFTTCHRVFSKGWSRMKLYFMIGLPTETDEDVYGIAEMGRTALEIGEHHKRRVAVTVSVSSHVPKPHTPFQWCAMDTLGEIERKQQILWALSRRYRYNFRRHDMKISHLEAIVARGDIRTGWLIERAWELGARFDGWDECLNWEAWQQALDEFEAKFEVDRTLFLQTIPTDARLPWDHIDVGLEDGFLLREYQKALKGRLSPPCGKPKGAKVHHTNLADLEGDERKLICYNCGIACDMTHMREERGQFLQQLDALEPPVPTVGNTRRDNALVRIKKGMTPHDFKQGKKQRYRIKYTKLGAISLQGHLDMVRILPRVLRRAGIGLFYSEGFNPKPVMIFAPALRLGAFSVAEYVDIASIDDISAEEFRTRFASVSPDGMQILAVRKLGENDRGLSKIHNRLDFFIGYRTDELAEMWGVTEDRVAAVMQARCTETMADVDRKVIVPRKKREVALRFNEIVDFVEVYQDPALALATGMRAARLGLRFRIECGDLSLRPVEVARNVLGVEEDPRVIVRLNCLRTEDDVVVDPMAFGDPNPESVSFANEQPLAPELGGCLVPTVTPNLTLLAQQPTV